MKNKYLEVFKTLDNLLMGFPDTRPNYKYIRILVKEQLRGIEYNDLGEFSPEKISKQKLYGLQHGYKEAEVESDLANDNVDIIKIKQYLTNFVYDQPDCLREFKKIGYKPIIENSKPKKGRGNKTYVWLNIEAFPNMTNDSKDYIGEADNILADDIFEDSNSAVIEEVNSEVVSRLKLNNNILTVNYKRTDSSKIKPSLFTKLFFKNGELPMASFKGVIFIYLIWISFLIDILIVVFSIIVVLFITKLPNLKLWEAILFILFIPMGYMSWLWSFKPLHHLMTNRVAKVPLFFANANNDNAEIELYKGESKFRIARLTEFKAICPICSASIELAEGKPDQNAPLVGRCREAPHAHIYSFDRVTLKGYFLGHKGYLIDPNLIYENDLR